MDPVTEKESMLARCGSFWYKTLSDGDKKIARTLNSIACRTKINRQVQACSNLLRSGGYVRDSYHVISFSDKDVFWIGIEKALQKREGTSLGDTHFYWRGKQLTLSKGEWCWTDKLQTAAQDDSIPVLFPTVDGDEVVFPGNYRARYCLSIDKNLFVESIKDGFGRILTHGVDFVAGFGFVWFRENPLQLFPDFKIHTQSVVWRLPNLYSYTLQLDNVYGPVDRVVEYYRNHQTVQTFYLAAAQACGMAVVRSESKINKVTTLLRGVSYIMDDGTRYDAPYAHNILRVRTTLPAGYVIGGDDLFTMYGPGDTLPSDITGIELDRAFPVKNLIASNKEGVITKGGKPYPELDGTGAAAYKALLGTVTGTEVKGNVLTYVRDTMLANRCIVVRINHDYMDREMELHLEAFIRREAPLGAVLTYSPITSTINAEI